MKLYNFIALLPIALVSASGDAEPEADATAGVDTAVVKLTNVTFNQFIEEHPLVLAEFYAPWCGYCKMVGPELVKAAATLNTSYPDIKIAQIDCTEQSELCKEHGIQGYPTMKIGRKNPADLTAYNGPREAAGIVSYMVRQSLPAIQIANTTAQIDTFLSESTVLFQIGKPKKSQAKVFDALAQKARDEHTFVLVAEPKLVKHLLSKLPKVEAAKSGAVYVTVLIGEAEEASAFSDKLTVEALAAYHTANAIPFFGMMDRDTYPIYAQSKQPLAYYIFNTTEEYEEKRAFFDKLARSHRGKLNFVSLNGSEYGRHAETLNMDHEIMPLFAIDESASGKKFGISQKEYPKGPSNDVIRKFVKEYLAGKAVPIIKSEPVPTAEEAAKSPVVKLVGHNYEEIIGDVSKDIFVEFYAPWCGHCKKLMPIWERLAKTYETKPEIVVAQMDHTANSLVGDFEIEGYPTLMLFPANGEKDGSGMRKPITFKGAREIDALIDFIKESGAHAVDGHPLKPELTEAEKEAEKATEAPNAINLEDVKIEGDPEIIEEIKKNAAAKKAAEEGGDAEETKVAEDDVEHDEL